MATAALAVATLGGNLRDKAFRQSGTLFHRISPQLLLLDENQQEWMFMLLILAPGERFSTREKVAVCVPETDRLMAQNFGTVSARRRDSGHGREDGASSISVLQEPHHQGDVGRTSAGPPRQGGYALAAGETHRRRTSVHRSASPGRPRACRRRDTPTTDVRPPLSLARAATRLPQERHTDDGRPSTAQPRQGGHALAAGETHRRRTSVHRSASPGRPRACRRRDTPTTDVRPPLSLARAATRLPQERHTDDGRPSTAQPRQGGHALAAGETHRRRTSAGDGRPPISLARAHALAAGGTHRRRTSVHRSASPGRPRACRRRDTPTTDVRR